MCQRSLTEQENAVRHKKGKKTEESRSVANDREAKPGKHHKGGIERKSTARQEIQMKFSLIYPKPSLSDVAQKEMPLESHAARKVTNSDKSIRPLSAAEPSQEMQIIFLAFVIVRFVKL